MAATISLPNLPSLPPPPSLPPRPIPPRDPHSLLEPATEMPLVTNATNAQIAAMRRPRRHAGVVLVLLIAAGAGVAGAVMFESAIRPPAPLNKTLARHWMVAQQLERVKAPPPEDTKDSTTEVDTQITETVENNPTLTPEDLVPLTQPAEPPAPRHRASKTPRRTAPTSDSEKPAPVVEQPAPPSTSPPSPNVENPDRGKSRREKLYRRD